MTTTELIPQPQALARTPNPDELIPAGQQFPVASPPQVSSLSILDAAIRGGINKDNVEVVERLVALRREEMREDAKRVFAQAFLNLRRNMPEICIDSAAKDTNGNIAYRYCSEREISEKLEPVLLQHGFAMMAGQRQDGGMVVITITLIHEGGHQEVREYAVHPGATNRMKDATAVDTGATTSAWRHLVQKMFGLKSRMRAEDDARNLGAQITRAQAAELEHRVAMTNSDRNAFLKFAGAKSFAEIMDSKYAILDGFLARKEGRK